MYIKILQYPWNMALHKLSVNYDIVKGRGEVKYLAERADIIKIILRIQFCASLPVSFPFPSPCLTSCLSPASLNCQHTCTFLMVMAKPQCQLERKVTFHGWCNWRRVFLRSRGGSAFWESLRTLAYSKVTYLGYWIIFEKKNTWSGLNFYCGSPSYSQGLSEWSEQDRLPSRGRIWIASKGKLQVIGSSM